MARLLVLLLLWPLSLLNAQLADNFSDGDFSADPAWSGDTTGFWVEAGELRSNGPAESSTLHLSTPQTDLGHTEWRIRVRLDFDPSSTNLVRVYLVSDQADLEGALNGYYLQIGETAATTSDSIDLFRADGESSVKLLTSSFPCITSATRNTIDLRVLRTASGTWTLWADCSGSGVYDFGASAEDTTHAETLWFGVYCQYATASRADKYFFDSIYVGPEIVDSEPPFVQELRVAGPDALQLVFSEAVDPLNASEPSRYFADCDIGNPMSAQVSGTNPAWVDLGFEEDFPDGLTCNLEISGVTDRSGNAMADQEMAFGYTAVRPFDLVITEIMADETPSGGLLPEAEFIEVYNRSGGTLDLNNWTLRDASAAGSAVIQEVELGPGELLILCRNQDTSLFSVYGQVLGLSGFPSLNNDGDRLELRTPDGLSTHQLDYTSAWYQNSTKSEGGWSLEMIDPDRPWLGTCNWKAAAAPAQGTPGRINSVNRDFDDEEAPSVAGAGAVDPATLRVIFSEAMDSLSLLATENYTIVEDLGRPIIAVPEGPDFRTVLLSLSDLMVTGNVYQLTVSGVQDCSGNPVGVYHSVPFGLPEVPDSLDLVINEILFDPKTGGVDFIEIYNRSQKIVEQFNLFIAEPDPLLPGEKLEVARVSADGRLLFPGEYVVLTEDPVAVSSQFPGGPQNGMLEVSGMPSWPDSDQEGIVSIEYRDGGFLYELDRVRYHRDWHFDLLDATEGVSLERINPAGDSRDQQNWHSAAQGAGFGTPAQQNSVFVEGAFSAPGKLVLAPEVFSPDQDGFDDVIQIAYSFTKPGFTASLYIFNASGRPVRKLAGNQNLGVQGIFTWDGVDETGEKAAIGIYLVLMEAFDLSGNVLRFTGRCVLAAKLN